MTDQTETTKMYEALSKQGAITIGGSRIGHERFSGPPSRTFPILRDLGDVADKARILVELDLEGERIIGLIARRSATALHVWKRVKGEKFMVTPTGVSFKSILAFRVISVEVDKLPVDLS